MGGLSASMWSSVSGLLAHGEKMGVISNNIANINTVAFKGSRMDFADFLSADIGTSNGINQIGRGVRLGIVMGDFSQGTLETTTSSTDIAITGNGFFRVQPKGSSMEYYTRAGNFYFDAEGYLLDPNGYVLQGSKIEQKSAQAANASGGTVGIRSSSGQIGNGVMVDIRLDTFTCPPRHTNNISTAVNLDSTKGTNDRTQNEDNPFFSLLETWDATQKDASGKIQPLGDNSAAWSNTIEVFDEGGRSRTLTIYYDRVEKTVLNNITGLHESQIVWEYIVTMPPEDDLRDFNDDGYTMQNHKKAGLLMAGTLTFDSAGQLEDMTAYVPNGITEDAMLNYGTWVQAPISANGYAMFCPNFTGREAASTAWNTASGTSTSPTEINPNTNGYLIELNFGLRSTSHEWMGTMPATIAEWNHVHDTPPLDLYFKPEKSDKAPGTIIREVGEFRNPPTNTIRSVGVVGADGVLTRVYDQFDPAPANSVLVGGIYYEQKRASDSPGTNEVVVGGWVYQQQMSTTNNPIYSDGGVAPYYEFVGGMYYEVDGTFTRIPATPGLPSLTTPTALSSGLPVASNRPANSGAVVYRVDSAENYIPLVTSRAHTGFGTASQIEATATTSRSSSNDGNAFYEHQNTQDGYTFGDLRSIVVNQNGVLSGLYSNGVTLDLYQIHLFDFRNKQDLRREGNNLFTETRDSGLALKGIAGYGTFGKTESFSLEGSNVDLSRELVQMITTQRGFQANSKSVTTVDTMLETVISMKR